MFKASAEWGQVSETRESLFDTKYYPCFLQEEYLEVDGTYSTVIERNHSWLFFAISPTVHLSRICTVTRRWVSYPDTTSPTPGCFSTWPSRPSMLRFRLEMNCFPIRVMITVEIGPYLGSPEPHQFICEHAQKAKQEESCRCVNVV